MKLFTYAFLMFTPFAAVGLDLFFQKKYWIPIGISLLILQSYTALHDYGYFAQQRVTATFFTKQEFELANRFKELRRSPDSLVLITPKHNHWISNLDGNPILMAYPGWLWSWGISYSEREKQIQEILTGGPHAIEWLAQFPVEYIVVNDQEKMGNIPVSIPFLKAHFPVLIENGLWHVFKAKQ